jgi:hypothetical protein
MITDTDTDTVTDTIKNHRHRHRHDYTDTDTDTELRDPWFDQLQDRVAVGADWKRRRPQRRNSASTTKANRLKILIRMDSV